MLPVSTRPGNAVSGFPDVCKLPAPGSGPVPIPYPNQAMIGQAKTALKTAAIGVSPIAHKTPVSASVQDLRNQLQRLHAQIMVQPAGNPNRWHELVDHYAIATAGLYIALTSQS